MPAARAALFASACLGFALAAPAPPPAPPVPPKDHVYLGNQLFNKGDAKGAAAEYQAAIQAGQNLAFAWFNLGNCRAQAGDLPQALVAYRRSLEEAPEFTRAWLAAGDMYFSLGAIGEATACYRRVLELDGPTLHAYRMLGECALKGGDVTEALEQFDQALKLEPGQVDVYFAQAEAYARLRDYKGAEKTLEDAIWLTPKAPASAFFYLGQLYEADGNPRKAVQAYEDGLALAPGKAEYWRRIARIHMGAKEDYLALLALERAIKSGADLPELRLERGLIFFGQKRYDRAADEFLAAYREGSPQGRDGLENVAAVYFNGGDKAKADSILAALR